MNNPDYYATKAEAMLGLSEASTNGAPHLTAQAQVWATLAVAAAILKK